MPNMSYCRFENTYNDLCDCLAALKDEGLDGIESARERHAAEDLMKLATRYAEVYRDAERMRQAAELGITPDE
jgi:hypothetical protein